MTTLSEAPEEALEIPSHREDKVRVKATTFLWLSPAGFLVLALFIVPTVYAIYIGFTNMQLLGPHAQFFNFTGTQNVSRLVHDPVFWTSVKLTLIFVIGSGILAQTVIGFALALLSQRAHFTVRSTVGSIVILAWVLPEIAVAFIWYSFGQAGGALSQIIGRPTDNLLSTVPLLIVCVANAWRGTAFSMLILSAGLRNVPLEVDEAAQLEGASYWKRLLTVTIPIMRPTIMVNMLLITIGTISDFTLIYVMTQGGPGNETAILPVYMYIEAFQFNQLGYGTMVALALIVIGAVLSLVYVRQLKPELQRAR